MTTVALIGSPFQLLSLFEARRAGAVAEAPNVLFQGASSQYGPLLDKGSHLVGDVVAVSDLGPSRTAWRLRKSAVLVLGDAYSRLAHVALAARSREELIVLEDGGASLRAIRSIAIGKPPLVRAHDSRVLSRCIGSSMLRQMNARPALVTVVFSLPHEPSVLDALRGREVRVVRHRYEWTRETWPQEAASRTTGRLVLGSSLAADRLVDEARYLRWLAGALSGAETTFRPHRREVDSARRLASEILGSVDTDDALPVEAMVSRSCFSEIVTLPSTAALTLPIICPRATLTCEDVPDSWWKPGVPSPMIELLSEIASAGGREIDTS